MWEKFTDPCRAGHDYFQLEGVKYTVSADTGQLSPSKTVVCCRKCAHSVLVNMYREEKRHARQD